MTGLWPSDRVIVATPTLFFVGAFNGSTSVATTELSGGNSYPGLLL